MDPVWPLRLFQFCPRCGSQDCGATSIKQFDCRACGLQYFHNTAAAVMAIVPNEQGELLFTRRTREPAKGTLDLPGGFVDPLEGAVEALHREIKEELALEIVSSVFLASFPNRYDFRGVTYYTSDLVFVCEADLGSLRLDPDEVSEVVFRRPEEVRLEEIGLASVRMAVEAYRLRNIP